MNNILSFKRIGLILRADWMESRRAMLISFGLLMVAYIFLTWDLSTHRQSKFFVLAIFMSLIYFFGFIKRKVHNPKGLSLTLPASTLEKYIAFWLVGIISFLVCGLSYWGIVTINALINGIPTVGLSDLFGVFRQPALFVFLTTWLVAFYVTFRKHAFLIGIVVLIALIMILVRLAWGMINQTVVNESFQEKMTDLFIFIGNNYSIVFYLLSAGLIYFAYWKLSKKQIR